MSARKSVVVSTVIPPTVQFPNCGCKECGRIRGNLRLNETICLIEPAVKRQRPKALARLGY